MTRFKMIGVLGAALVLAIGCARKGAIHSVYVATDASAMERLAASEIRRYLYVTSGELARIVPVASLSDLGSAGIVVERGGRFLAAGKSGGEFFDAPALDKAPVLGAEEYWLKTVRRGGRRYLFVCGGGDPGVLYGAYALAEKFGVRFYLDGDVVPDERAAAKVPDLDEIGRPLFALRGIQPFHDFAEGPDWWNEDDYRAVFAQLAKLRMNFFGLHTYPEKNPNAEPAVWIGTAGDAGPDGRVKFSYPSSWQNTLRSNPGSHNWGYQPTPTGRFHLGASLLFERDDYGADVMAGLMPEPETAEQSNELFNRTGAMLGRVFSLARRLGIKTCLGTETPLTIPALVRDRLKRAGLDPDDPKTTEALYEGIFKRIAASAPVDYYWFWTTENWTWSDAKDEDIKAVTTDLAMAVRAARAVDAPFSLATCGWVLGPPSRRTLFDDILPKTTAVSCINREVGKAPVDSAFARISGRPKWAIPWMEDDPSLTSPQLWAGRMRRDAVDAFRYGCQGLFGIHWRTRILSPNIAALAGAAWDQSWNTLPLDFAGRIGPLNGVFVKAPEAALPGADEAAVYRDVRDRVNGYRLLVPDGTYAVTLKFCETEFDKKGARVFDIAVQSAAVAEKVDIFERAGRYKPFDLTFRAVEVKNGRLDIDFVDRIHYPAVAGIVVEGTTTAGAPFVQKINCGGPKVLDYDADWPETPRFLPVLDLYADWARNQFGRGADGAIAAIFARIDGKLPIPVDWTNGPGGIKPAVRPWADAVRDFAFVDELAALRPRIQGTGNLARFDYWLKQFEAMRETAHFETLWADYNRALDKVKGLPDAPRRADSARETLVPVRTEMVKSLKIILGSLTAAVGTRGEMGTIANWEQHLLPDAFLKPGQELKSLLGGILPAYADLPSAYEGPVRIVAPTVRTLVEAGESPAVKIAVLSVQAPVSVTLFWRELGRKKFAAVPMERADRGVYKASLPPLHADVEYYILARADDREAVFPVTAPALNQTIVVMN